MSWLLDHPVYKYIYIYIYKYINHFLTEGGFGVWGSWSEKIHKIFSDLSTPDRMQLVAFYLFAKKLPKIVHHIYVFNSQLLKFQKVINHFRSFWRYFAFFLQNPIKFYYQIFPFELPMFLMFTWMSMNSDLEVLQHYEIIQHKLIHLISFQKNF